MIKRSTASTLLIGFMLLVWPAKPISSTQALSAQQQRELSFSLFAQQWEDLRSTPAFQPAPFVPGVIRAIDPSANPRVDRTVFGYYAGEGYDGINFELLSHLALAFVDADDEGDITHLPLSSRENWYEAINAAHDQGVQVVLVVRNEEFRSDVLSDIVRDQTKRETLITNLLDEITLHELDGVSVDFENVNAEDRDFVTLFMQELDQAFYDANPDYHISFATPAYDWDDDFDYPAIAEVADALLMMQYVYYGSWSTNAGPQAPVERKEENALSIIDSIQDEFLEKKVPADKLVQLMPYYGYQWVVAPYEDPSSPGVAVIQVFETLRINDSPFENMTYDDTIDLRGQHFHYFYADGFWVQGWCDDAESIGKKIDLVSELGLQGVGMWRLEYGNGYPELWEEVRRRLVSPCPNRPSRTPANRWKLEIWNNRDLTGPAVEQRLDAVAEGGGFNFNWGNGRPSDCTGTDNFSIRFSRRAYFESSATYLFKTTTDDGVRLYVDGHLLIDRWRDMAPTEYTGIMHLDAGYHDVQMDYYEKGGGAVAKLSWQETASCWVKVPQESWKGEYYGNKNLSGPPLMLRDDGDGFLSFDWGSSSPGSFCDIATDNFSARWTRTADFNSGTYRFTIVSDDGFRLHVDDSLKLEKWFDQGPTTYNVDVPLTAGDHTIKLEYYEHGGGAVAKLSWSPLFETTNGWAYPVGDADSGKGWKVTNPLGNSWSSSTRRYRGHLGEDWFKNEGTSSTVRKFRPNF